MSVNIVSSLYGSIPIFPFAFKGHKGFDDPKVLKKVLKKIDSLKKVLKKVNSLKKVLKKVDSLF